MYRYFQKDCSLTLHQASDLELFFIMTASLKNFRSIIKAYLSVSAVLALAFSTDEHVSLGAAHFGELMLSNGLLGQHFPDLFKLCACHLLPNM